CEGYLKKLDCFYRCSPDAARWSHAENPATLIEVPLCLGFCNKWFEACKNDLTCNWNWKTDMPKGLQENCTGDCITYGQMYRNAKHLCNNIWGDFFSVAKKPCRCLSLNPADLRPSAEDSDTTKKGTGKPQRFCKVASSPPINPRRDTIRRRSLFMEDVEGSGSGS
uniref:Retbindin n=2 Tax=Latimeria chalumnae TaxID=7897 RepID=H3AJ36_LATCH